MATSAGAVMSNLPYCLCNYLWNWGVHRKYAFGGVGILRMMLLAFLPNPDIRFDLIGFMGFVATVINSG
jgi:hypothetical protein